MKNGTKNGWKELTKNNFDVVKIYLINLIE